MILKGNRVALYARFSSDNQRSESIDAQIRAMEQYCKQHNYIIVERYVDEAKSATTDRRPAFQKLIADSALKIFDIVMVHKLDRFARNRYDSAVYKRELKKNGVTVYSVLEALDNSPESIMLEAVLEGMNEYYSQNLARETMKGMRETALQAKHTGGKPALGYDVDPITRKLVINEEEAEAVRIIFSMYAAGYGYDRIIEVLHEKRLLTKRKQEFVKNSLYSILTNPKYQGNYVFNRRAAKDALGKRNNHRLKNAEEIIFIEGGCPQIIDAETYEKVQFRIIENKRAGGRKNAKENYLLSGTVYCKECGKSMTGNARKGGRSKQKYVTYRCPGKKHTCSNYEINKKYLDSYVLALIKRHILTPTALKKITENVQKLSRNTSITASSEHENLKERLSKIQETLRSVTDSVLQSGIVSEALATRLHELEEEKAKLEADIALSDTAAEFNIIDADTLLLEYDELKKTPSSPAYKELIRSLIRKIEVGKYSVSITLKTGLGLYPSLDTTYKVSRKELYETGKKR